MDVGNKKGKEKVEEKRKELVFFKGILLVDLDECDVSNNRLNCDSDDLDDDNAPNPEYMDVGDGGASSLQYLEPNTGPTVEPLQSSVQVHSDCSSEPTPSSTNLLFNAIGKAPYLDAVIMK